MPQVTLLPSGSLYVEVKTLGAVPQSEGQLYEALRSTLQAMAYSLRGNPDPNYRVLLLLHADRLRVPAQAERSELFRFIQTLATPYWEEFGQSDAPTPAAVEHLGCERFQIWIESGGKKATPTFLVIAQPPS